MKLFSPAASGSISHSGRTWMIVDHVVEVDDDGAARVFQESHGLSRWDDAMAPQGKVEIPASRNEMIDYLRGRKVAFNPVGMTTVRLAEIMSAELAREAAERQAEQIKLGVAADNKIAAVTDLTKDDQAPAADKPAVDQPGASGQAGGTGGGAGDPAGGGAT